MDEFWKRLYQWWDHVDTKGKSSAIRETAVIYGDPELNKMLERTSEALYSSQHNDGKLPQKSTTAKFRNWLESERLSDGDLTISEMQREYTEVQVLKK